MKKNKLKMDSFFDNKLENLSAIVGGGERPRLEAPSLDEGGPGGSTVSNGSGSGHPPPTGIPPVIAEIL